jgi:hypothetical protein
MVLAFPGAEEGFNMRSAVFKVNSKVLARVLGDGEIMLTGVGPDEIDHLIESDPATFHATRHFRDASCIAARLASLDPEVLRSLLERRFRQIAKKTAVKAWDAAHRQAADPGDGRDERNQEP